MFVVNVSKSDISVIEKETLASGAQKAYQVSFVFDEDWNGLAKTAVFRAGASANVSPCNDKIIINPVEVAVMGTETIYIPQEVLTIPYLHLQIGVRGTADNGEIIIPTAYCDLGKIAKGTERGTNAVEPTPEVIDQLLAVAEEAASMANQSDEKAERAKELVEALGVKMGVAGGKFEISENGHLVLEFTEMEGEHGNN